MKRFLVVFFTLLFFPYLNIPVQNVRRAGLGVLEEENLFIDVFKLITATP
jgi:hypothetical protein